jgi:hypothetical protein
MRHERRGRLDIRKASQLVVEAAFPGMFETVVWE